MTTHVTAYTKLCHDRVQLRDWHGRTVLDIRSETVQAFRPGEDGYSGAALVFRLPHGRGFIVGYALDVDGALFPGELVSDFDAEQAAVYARTLADYWRDVDANADAAWADEQAALAAADALADAAAPDSDDTADDN